MDRAAVILSRAFIDRDREAAGWAVVSVYRHALLRYALYTATDPGQAEDWISGACMHAPRLAARWDASRNPSFEAYMLTMLQFYIRHQRQRDARYKARLQKYRERGNFSDHPIAPTCIIDGDLPRMLDRLHDYDSELATVLKEVYYDGCTISAVAAKWKTSRATVRLMLDEAIRLLRGWYDGKFH